MDFFFQKVNRQTKEAKISLGGREVTVRVRHLRTARRLTLRVSPSGEPVLTVPSGLGAAEIQRFLGAQGDWLAQRLGRWGAAAQIFAPGTIIPLRGEEVLLCQNPAGRGVKRQGATVQVGGQPEHFARRTEDFLRAEARRVLSERTRHYAAELGVTVRRVTVRDTTSRWGSCSADGSLSFSWRLILAPPPVLEYVVAHEVAHRLELNHSPRFWAVVARLMPGFEVHVAWLKSEGHGLHRYGAVPMT